MVQLETNGLSRKDELYYSVMTDNRGCEELCKISNGTFTLGQITTTVSDDVQDL